MFFVDNHLRFFKPLSGKYRERILGIFSEAITRTQVAETARGRFRTRHRNTRNTRNTLQAFLERGDVHNPLAAYEYAARGKIQISIRCNGAADMQ